MPPRQRNSSTCLLVDQLRAAYDRLAYLSNPFATAGLDGTQHAGNIRYCATPANGAACWHAGTHIGATWPCDPRVWVFFWPGPTAPLSGKRFSPWHQESVRSGAAVIRLRSRSIGACLYGAWADHYNIATNPEIYPTRPISLVVSRKAEAVQSIGADRDNEATSGPTIFLLVRTGCSGRPASVPLRLRGRRRCSLALRRSAGWFAVDPANIRSCRVCRAIRHVGRCAATSRCDGSRHPANRRDERHRGHNTRGWHAQLVPGTTDVPKHANDSDDRQRRRNRRRSGLAYDRCPGFADSERSTCLSDTLRTPRRP
jgi:hypothetical protein